MISLRAPLLAFTAMVVLLALTVAASFVLKGPAGFATSIGIAAAKAALIFWVFMQLRKEGGLIRLFALGAVVWLAILMVLSGADYVTRADRVLPRAGMSTDLPATTSPLLD